ncbi:hypothetical protein Q8A67_001538 [Cirrhinus molitorella]|uniref:Uncharacterized protein n=1 Tax=Cirrhinus molitorella TaxID=172907 RepID=A0AA88QRU0_9TELE|nr:hypothetical protein Q8A67_001538 [Cirrhinus molitorella]
MDKSVTCAEIQTPLGFLYVVLPVIMNHTNNPDCEQSWYLEDGHLIADPSDPQALSHPAAAVKSDHLVTSLCVNLNHQIICHSADGFCRYKTVFRPRGIGSVIIELPSNATSAFLSSKSRPFSPSIQLRWIFVLIFIFLLVLICFLLRKRIIRCFQKSEHLCDTRNYSESRDPEVDVQKQLRSDPPDSLNSLNS